MQTGSLKMLERTGALLRA